MIKSMAFSLFSFGSPIVMATVDLSLLKSVMMLKKVPIYLLLLLLAACASQQRVQPIQVDAEPENVELQLQQHWQLSYFDEPVFNSKVAVLEAGNKNNSAIILIHGVGQLGMKDWFSVIPVLEKKYHVIAMDLPGFGLSAVSKGRFLPTNYARVIAAISQQYSHEKAIVVGHSMGGAVALRYTELNADLVKQLILVDVAGLLEKSAFIKHIASIELGDDISAPMKLLIEGVNEFSASMIEAGTKSSLISDFLQSNDYVWNWLVEDSSNMNAALSLVEEEFNHAVNQITVPVDIIWGDKDNVAPLRTGKVLHKQMRYARLQVIKGAGHVPMKSNSVEFMRFFNIALNKPITEQYALPTIGKSQGILTCFGQSDLTYSGRYDTVSIESCDNIRLLNVSTDRLSIKGSVVDIENFSFDNNHTQIKLNGSVVTITNADISGHNILSIHGSRLDMAGVSFKATGNAVMIVGGSRISASFCDISSPEYSGLVHGAFYLSNQPLVE